MKYAIFFWKIVEPYVWGWIKRLFVKKKILVIGCGGVGKTSLGKLLANNLSMAKITTDYVETINTEVVKAKGKGYKAEIHILAGQKHRRETTWTSSLNEVQNGGINGIILVSAYGITL